MLSDIRPARLDEREALISLQLRSSMADPAFPVEVLETPGAIDVPADWIAAGQVYVASGESGLTGFVTLVPDTKDAFELEGLFVDPDCWKQGIGRALVERAIAHVRGARAGRLHLIANPNALGFYVRLRFTVTGEKKLRFGTGLLMEMVL